MLLRWILPVVTVLAFLASSVTAFAASGVIGDTSCCCPDPDLCKCHDHDGDPLPAPEMKRCGSDAKVVAAQLVPIVVVVAETPPIATRTGVMIVHAMLPMPPARDVRPEKPPF